MTEIILSQWVIASALGALCLVLVLFCLVPALVITRRLQGVRGAIGAVRADGAQFRDNLFGEMRGMLDRAGDRQIEASGHLHAQLIQHLAQSLQPPLDGIAESLREFGNRQSTDFSEALQQQMAAFAERLDLMLGGQVSNARELQQQTLSSLESAAAAFQDMSRSIAASAESATQSMVKQLRASVARSQAEIDANMTEHLGKLSAQVTVAVTALQEQAALAGRNAVEQQQKIAEFAQRSFETLSSEVRAQTEAVEFASQSMRAAGSDVAGAVDRIVEGMTGLISGAAQEFTRSSQGFTDIFDKSRALSEDLAQTAAALASSSKDIGTVVDDYRNARQSLEGMVDVMRSTVESARSDTTVASDFVTRIEAAAQKLMAAQGQADQSLEKLNGVLNEAHSAFNAQLLESVRGFHEHLGNGADEQPDEAGYRRSDYDRMISAWVQATPHVRPPAPAARDRGEETARFRAVGNGGK